MSGKLDHVSKSWNNTERSARNASPPRSAIGRVPYAPKPPAAFTKSWNRPRPNPSARFKPISGPPHRRSCWPSRRYVAVPCTATLSTAPPSRGRSRLKTRTATRIYFIYSAVRHLSNQMAVLPGAVAGRRFPHGRAELGRLREGRHPRGPDRRGRGLPQSTEARLPAAHRLRRARREDLERADHAVLRQGRSRGEARPGGGELSTAPDREFLLGSPDARCGAGRRGHRAGAPGARRAPGEPNRLARSEEHTSELQSRLHLVCRLLLEKKKRSATPGHLLAPRNILPADRSPFV